MKDSTNKIILTLTLIGIIAGLTWLYTASGHNSQTEKLKQAATETQTATDKAKTNYSETKTTNTKREKEVTQNAYQKACENCSNDADTLIAWAQLIKRAREHNRQRGGGTDKN